MGFFDDVLFGIIRSEVWMVMKKVKNMIIGYVLLIKGKD